MWSNGSTGAHYTTEQKQWRRSKGLSCNFFWRIVLQWIGQLMSTTTGIVCVIICSKRSTLPFHARSASNVNCISQKRLGMCFAIARRFANNTEPCNVRKEFWCSGPSGKFGKEKHNHTIFTVYLYHTKCFRGSMLRDGLYLWCNPLHPSSDSTEEAFRSSQIYPAKSLALSSWITFSLKHIYNHLYLSG